jgi:uncharacterized protein YdgA (DUF945 family)
MRPGIAARALCQRTTMRKFLILFVVIGAVVLILPGVIGFQMETRYQELLQQMPELGLSVIEEDYQRGWFGATAETELRISLPEQGGDGDEDIRFTLSSAIAHGPLLSAGVGLGEIDSEVKMDGERLFPAEYPASIKTLIALDGSGRMQLELPAITLEPHGERPGADFSGLSGNLSFDAAFAEAKAEVRTAGVVIHGTGNSLIEIGPLTLDSRSWAGPAGLTLGNANFQLQRLLFNNPSAGGQVLLTGLGAEMESSDQEQMVGGSATYRLETAQIGGVNYGPALLQFEFSNFSAPVVARMQQQLEEMNNQNLSGQQQSMVVMSVLADNISQLLKHDPRVALRELRLVTPDGVVEGRVSLQSKGLLWEEIGQPGKLLDKLAADMSLRIPERLLRLLLQQQAMQQIAQQYQQRSDLGGEVQLPDAEELQAVAETLASQQLDTLLTQGLLERDGDRIGTVAVLADGLLTINGKSVPLQMFQQQ